MNSYVMLLFISLSIFAADDASQKALVPLSSTGSERRVALPPTHVDFPGTPVNTPHHSPEVSPVVSPPDSPSSLRRGVQARLDHVEDRALLQEIEEALEENAFWGIISFCAILVSMYYYHID